MSLAIAVALVVLAQSSGAPTSTLTVTLTPTTAEDVVPDSFEVLGNEALPESVYRALVNLPEDVRPTARTARQARERILRFLRLAGYELARVEVKVQGRKLVVTVDEGRLERFVFLGQTGFKAMRFQLMLDLPGRVFNRPELEKQLDRFRREEDLHITEYSVLPVKGATTASGLFSGEVAGVELVPDQGSYELHIRVQEVEYPTGWGMELRGESPDGIVTGLRYRFGEVFADEDRLEVAASFGFRPQKLFGGGDGQTWISRAGGRTAWISPKLFDSPVRVMVRGDGLWMSRARLDLGITRYERMTIQPTLRLMFRPHRWVDIDGGGGVLLDNILSVQAEADFEPDQEIRLEPIVFVNTRFSFGEDEVRRDRRHDIGLGVTQHLGANLRTHARADYEKSYGFGWNDLVLSAAVAGVFGDRPFYALERVGTHVKGAYGDRLYGWAVGSAGVDFRWSLSRENLKVGLAYDAAVFARDLGPERSKEGFVNALSAGLHMLFLNSFRLSVYLVGAYAVGEDPEAGLSLSFAQVF